MLNNKSTIFATLVVFLGFTLRFASATPPVRFNAEPYMNEGNVELT